MPAKPKMTPQDRRQGTAQNAIVAIAISGDPPAVILSELTRLQRFLNHTWDEVQDRARDEGEVAA